MAEVYSKEEYRRIDQEHMVHGQTVPSVFHREGTLLYASGHGIRLVDLDGKEYLDGMSGGACCSIGFGREEVGEVAKQQAIKLSHYPDFGGRGNIAELDLAAKLAEIAPGKIVRFMFQNSGSDSVEGAVKIARFYWAEKDQKNKHLIIAANESYHGTTTTAISISDQKFYLHPDLEPPEKGILHAPTIPFCYHCRFGKSYPGCNMECARSLEELIKQVGANNVAAFITEVMWAGGGMYVAPKEWTQVISEICKKYNILLAVDEVLTGFGKNGKMWCSDIYEVKPDILIFSKGLTSGYMPFSGLGITDAVYQGIIIKDSFLPLVHTFSGHCVCCAVALKVIEIVEREKLCENSARMGKYIHSRFQNYLKYPYVGDVRGGLGLMHGVELVAGKTTKEPLNQKAVKGVVSQCYKNGVIVTTFGDNIIRLAPPLIVTQEEADTFVDVLEEAIKNIKV